METRRYIVHGQVQGVGFRAFAREQARALGLRGYVRNLADGGSVEAVAMGDAAALSAFERCLRAGPPGALVTSLEATDAPGGTWPSFEVTR